MTRTGVIIPTRACQPDLPELLKTLLADESLGEACIAVVCNGAEQDPDIVHALETLQRLGSPSDERRLELMFLDTPSKPDALNTGEEIVGDCDITIYIDDDIRISSGRVGYLKDRLLGLGKKAGLVAPRRIVTPGCHWKERLFGACVLRPPWVCEAASIGGIFAVNRAGRSRWDIFPPVACDDEYVFSRFAHSERVLESGCVATHPYANTWRSILDQQARWRAASLELRTKNLVGPHPGSNRTRGMLARALLSPRMLASMMLVHTVRASARVFGRSGLAANGAWPEM